MISELQEASMADPASSSSRFISFTFNHSVSVKIDNENHLVWKQHITIVVRGRDLLHFLDGSKNSPPRFLSASDQASGQVNSAFLIEWE